MPAWTVRGLHYCCRPGTRTDGGQGRAAPAQPAETPGQSQAADPFGKLWTGFDELRFVPLSKTGAELFFEVFSQRYERGSVLVTSNLPFDEWTEVFGSERLTGALLDRLTHHVDILEMNGDSYRLKHSSQTNSDRAAD